MLKTVAVIASVVAFVVPLSTINQFMIFIGSLAVALVCFIVSSALDDEHIGYWPSKNNEQ